MTSSRVLVYHSEVDREGVYSVLQDRRSERLESCVFAFEAVLFVKCRRGVCDREHVQNLDTDELTYYAEAQPILGIIEIESCRVECDTRQKK